MENQPDCYGKMFPDLSRVIFNKWHEGKAFRMFVESSGMGIGGRNLEVKTAEWKQCVACASYPDCYDLSVATLLMHEAADSFGLARAL